MSHHLRAEKEEKAEDRSGMLQAELWRAMSAEQKKGFQEANNTGKPNERGPNIDLWI